ncbi:MAG: CHAT domain-containing protein, partial [Cyanothece sp. SIO2G6]|nr:CHAT domain-containing protein [Cyanothece sp. SIO2G6]
EQRTIIQDFQGFINSAEIQSLVNQLSYASSNQDLLTELDRFINLQNDLRKLEQNAVLIYPLMLDDRLELVLVTPFSEPTRYPVEVDRATLNRAIANFRQALTNPRRDPRPIAKQLYDWLISPMIADLEAIATETILYAPDGTLRYVPLAALYDGNQWLTQQFQINHITATSLQDFAHRPATEPQILAGAFSQGFYQVEAGGNTYAFDGLPFAGREVENLVAAFPNTTSLFDTDFSRDLTELAMDSHTIVHLATHAAFVSGTPNDSFILFGNGQHITLEELKGWEGRLNQVELFVLSACETGVGMAELGTGEEILGFGYLMQAAGAEAAIASLWSVSDGGTQVLMDHFYTALTQGHSKAEALRQAQIALITDDLASTSSDQRSIRLESHYPVTPPLHHSMTHPYYWAPFILIGNGL